jgi:hypothetical protein
MNIKHLIDQMNDDDKTFEDYKDYVNRLKNCNLSTIQKVYNLHVEDCHCYFVNSLLVLNCMDSLRYSTYSHFYNRGLARMTEQDAIEMEKTFGRR